MPAKNAAFFIEECIQSIIDQTHRNWELIVVDDHSEDQTANVIKSFAEKDSRIKLLKNPGSGIISALQAGYKHSSGIYITRMDADDVMVPIKLQRMRQALVEASAPTVVTGKVEYISEDQLGDGYLQYQNWLNALIDNSQHFKEVYKECVIPSPCWMTTRETFETCGAFDSTIYPEDYDLCFRFYEHGLTVAGVDEVLHNWRDHPARASRTDDNYAKNSFLDIKVNYFLKLDHNSKNQLLLWGAGKKGKKIARLLVKRNVSFIWATNNPNKIGHVIYGHKLQDIESTLQLDSPIQAIIAIADPVAQKAIKQQLKNEPNITAFWFS